jgi:hypothetical protein
MIEHAYVSVMIPRRNSSRLTNTFNFLLAGFLRPEVSENLIGFSATLPYSLRFPWQKNPNVAAR